MRHYRDAVAPRLEPAQSIGHPTIRKGQVMRFAVVALVAMAVCAASGVFARGTSGSPSYSTWHSATRSSIALFGFASTAC